ncbi:MAG: 3-isopropylmalate/(R)-2-methylmalate dehydratase small subunit [Campylobacterota bacterium]|nr:3-isopropylmalate/(R)-2-methylmalate dehydratase small subunit [Campylobacterota bacterium]
MALKKGRAWKFGKDIDTDVIIAARYLNTSNPKELARHVMEDSDIPDFALKVKENDIIIADENFGCGSSREHAPIAIKASGVQAVLAKSFARIFYRNAFNMGLAIYEVAETDKIDTSDELEIDARNGIIKNLTKNQTYTFKPIPPFMQELVEAGGLIQYAQKEMGL